ncbi:MAG: tetratricopeptide repeat protein [Deltaproteobacteria bacterium]|nr:tetratricopeptide repeat protein [Deltaproteobacteria bacterium]MBW1927829.1 tetratricopeptide repeat protein [Deltaproteobacteria bacterium]MBW2026714.1 tetratricopeptide repeat protein [Deltaproteobacteria bacterium]MBW2126566.1 tetratricopeptide repeat protein [Deltaproteobacteria bacterium]
MRRKEFTRPLDLAWQYLHKGDEHRAQQIVLAQRKHAPEDPELHIKWAELCEELGMARQAMEHYEAALKLDPKNHDALFSLGNILSEVGRFENSNHYLRKLLQQRPDHSKARELLYNNYEALGLVGQAEAVIPKKKGSSQSPHERYFPPCISKEQIEIFLKLFSGRELGYALETLDPDTGKVHHEYRAEPLDEEVVKAHLLGEISVAVYPLRSDNTVRYATLLLHVPSRVREMYARQHGYLLFLNEKARALAIKVVQQAQGFGVPVYIEEFGVRGYRVWFFFTEFVHFLKAKDFLNLFMERTEPSDSHIAVEFLLPTKPVGIGWIERCIPLPLGVDPVSNKRCFFLDQNGRPFDNQLIFLKKVRTLDLKLAIRQLRLTTEAREIKYWEPRSLPRLVEKLRHECRVLGYLIDRALSGHMLRREEKVILFYTVGLLDSTEDSLHQILEPTPDYNYRKIKKQLQRLQKNPISCLRIRSMIPEITGSVGCTCAFDLRGGKYPSPLLHVMPQLVPASEEIEIPDKLPLKEAAKRYAYLRTHIEEEKTTLRRLEKILERHFQRKGIQECSIDKAKIKLYKKDSHITWHLEQT